MSNPLLHLEPEEQEADTGPIDIPKVDEMPSDPKTFTYTTKSGETISLPLDFDLPDLTNPDDRVWLYVDMAEATGTTPIKLWFDRAGVPTETRRKFYASDPDEWEDIISQWVSARTDGVDLGE